MGIRKYLTNKRLYQPSPLRIALIYLGLGGLWILFSDRILAGFITDFHTLTVMQTYKGWFYVLVTAFLAYLLVSWSEKNLRDLLNQLNQKNSSLQKEMKIRIENEQRIQQLMSDLAEKNRELESIIYASSHDLRSPLITIQGFRAELSKSLDRLHVLVADVPQADSREIRTLLDNEIPESMMFIQHGAERLDLLLKGLQTFCRLGYQPMHIESVDAGELLDHVVKGLRYQIDQTRAVVTVGPLHRCRADRVLLEQVFINLIENALKYRRDDDSLRVTVESEVDGDTVVYSIQDNGIGIDPRYQAGIFQMYYQLNPSVGGQGLGLTIVRRILTRMNGKISLTSEPEQGSRFFVTLPAEGSTLSLGSSEAALQSAAKPL